MEKCFTLLFLPSHLFIWSWSIYLQIFILDYFLANCCSGQHFPNFANCPSRSIMNKICKFPIYTNALHILQIVVRDYFFANYCFQQLICNMLFHTFFCVFADCCTRQLFSSNSDNTFASCKLAFLSFFWKFWKMSLRTTFFVHDTSCHSG